ncbi:hypothetical protein J6590_005640 [Homalodisca vitripennis]|nr:hypothetical protein J6590_005640 [Homalodisca vitripennis]
MIMKSIAGLKQVGSLNLAQTQDRMIFLKRRMSCQVATGLQCELLGPNELKRLHPYLHTDDLVGAAWVPGDAVCNPMAICHTLATLATQGGKLYLLFFLIGTFVVNELVFNRTS